MSDKQKDKKENEDEEITYPVKVKRVLWDKFKDTIPRTKNLNEAIVELIENEVNKK